MSDVGVSLTVPVVLAVLVLAYWPVGLVFGLGLVVGALKYGQSINLFA